jgi:hypothetical protein
MPTTSSRPSHSRSKNGYGGNVEIADAIPSSPARGRVPFAQNTPLRRRAAWSSVVRALLQHERIEIGEHLCDEGMPAGHAGERQRVQTVRMTEIGTSHFKNTLTKVVYAQFFPSG